MMTMVLIAFAVWVLLSFPGAVLVGRAIKGPSDAGLRDVFAARGRRAPVR